MTFKSLRTQSKSSAASRLARIGKFAKGGKVADYDADDKPVAKAKKAAPVTVDGKPARPRLDRPGRRMRRAEGGPADKSPPNPGEVSNDESAKYLREKARDKMGSGLLNQAGASSLIGAGIGSASSTKKIPQAGGKRFATGLGGLLIGAGLPLAKRAYDNVSDSVDARREADKFTGRKRGGGVK